MNRRIGATSGALFFLLVAGCDAAKEPMAKAKETEAAGKFAEARGLYAQVCKASETSPLCAVAKERIEVVTVKEALALAAEGQHAKVKELSATVSGAPAKRAFETLLKSKPVQSGLEFDEVNALTDKAAARTKMEEMAAASSPVADKAKEWVTKNVPAMLLAEIKAACKPDGSGSCMELGKKIEKLFPESAEAKEAKPLVAAEYKRIHPLLKQAEALLVQRLEVYNWRAKTDLCLEQTEDGDLDTCKSEAKVPTDRADPFDTGFLEKTWRKKLDDIHDPGWVKQLEDRWSKVENSGIYDPADLPKPG